MNIINKFKIYLALFVILIFQLQLHNLKAEEDNLIDDEVKYIRQMFDIKDKIEKKQS